MHSWVTWFCQCKGNRVGKTNPLQYLTLNNRYRNDLEVTLPQSGSLLAIPGRTGIWKTGVLEVNLSGNQPQSQGPLRYPSLWSERERRRGPWEWACHGTCERPNNKLCNTPIRHWCWDVTPGHTGERQMLSPLNHPPLCYPCYGYTQGLDPWVPYLNRLSFARVNTVVAPPNEWPTTATLLKSNLPLNGKKCHNNRAIFSYTDWWKKKYGWWGHGLIMMVTQFVIFQDTAVTSPEKDLKYFALKPLAIPLEWVFSIFTAFLWYKLVVKKLLSIFFYVIEWET